MNQNEKNALRETAIVAMLRAGISWDKIRDSVACSYNTINRLAGTMEKREKVYPKTYKPRLHPKRVSEIVDLLSGPMNMSEIARAYGVSRYTVMGIKKKYATNL